MLRDNITRLQERAAHLARRTRDFSNNAMATGNSSRRRRQGVSLEERRSRTTAVPPLLVPNPSRRLPRESTPAHRRTLPTPPLDGSDPDSESLFVPENGVPLVRATHPLSNSWSPDSPADGLGDRNRSPTPADGWEIMRSTITPDATLPSADSSFTSAVASNSFSSTYHGDNSEPTQGSAATSSGDSRRNSSDDSQDDSASSVDMDDHICDDMLEAASVYADEMYDYEMTTAEGRERIALHEQRRVLGGNRFAFAHERGHVDVGFRLIEEALTTVEGQQRLPLMNRGSRSEQSNILSGFIEGRRNFSLRHAQSTHTIAREPTIMDDEAPSPHPERYGEEGRVAAREATAQVHDYFRRYTTDLMQSQATLAARLPPPQYEPLGSHPDVNAFTSRDSPQAHPVSPPTHRTQHDVVDAMLSGDEADLSAMQRVVERLARRDDVPEEWWMSMGLNLSRTRARAHSPRRTGTADASRQRERVRDGRVDRHSSRL